MSSDVTVKVKFSFFHVPSGKPSVDTTIGFVGNVLSIYVFTSHFVLCPFSLTIVMKFFSASALKCSVNTSLAHALPSALG